MSKGVLSWYTKNPGSCASWKGLRWWRIPDMIPPPPPGPWPWANSAVKHLNKKICIILGQLWGQNSPPVIYIVPGLRTYFRYSTGTYYVLQLYSTGTLIVVLEWIQLVKNEIRPLFFAKIIQPVLLKSVRSDHFGRLKPNYIVVHISTTLWKYYWLFNIIIIEAKQKRVTYIFLKKLCSP